MTPNFTEWLGVPVDAPGVSGERDLRITNIRINGNQAGVNSLLSNLPITAFISISSGGDNPITIPIQNPSQVLGITQTLPKMSVQPVAVPNNQSQSPATTPAANVKTLFPIGYLRMRFQSGPTPVTQLDPTPNSSESGRVNLGLPVPFNLSGQAASGTIIEANFPGLPASSSLFTNQVIDLKAADTGAIVGQAVSIPGLLKNVTNNIGQMPTINGRAIGAWEVTRSSPTVPIDFTFPVWLSYSQPVNPANVLGRVLLLPTGATNVNSFTSDSDNSCPPPCFSSDDNGMDTPSVNSYVSVATIFSPVAQPGLSAIFPSPNDKNSVTFQADQDPFLVPSTIFLPIVSPGPQVSSLSFTIDPPARWLSVALDRTVTPATATLTVDPKTPDGNYSTTLNIKSPQIAAPLAVPVTYTVAPVPWFTRYSVASAASYVNGAIAPGEMFIILGDGFGPAVLSGPELGADGRAVTSLANTQVLFDGQPAPLYYVVNNGTNGIVTGFAPFALNGKSFTKMQIVYSGVKSPPVNLFVLDALPALFTADSSGGGPGAILNQDGSYNSPSNPESRGNVVVLYGTGGGQMTPGGRDGALSGVGAPIGTFNLPFKVFMDGVPATDILYLGPAPGEVEGIFQINVRIPAAVHTGNVPVVIQVHDNLSQPGVTVAVK